VDVSFYRNPDRRKSWLRQYVIARNNLSGLPSVNASSDEIDRLYNQVEKFDLVRNVTNYSFFNDNYFDN